MQRRLPILLIALLHLLTAFAEQTSIYFEVSKHNFGVIAEDGGVVEHTFVGRNSTDAPIVILDVSAGCSCTKATYSRKPIMPGRECEVRVVFDPMNQPEGVFNRKAVVMTSQGNIPLTISGTITPRRRSIAEQYPLQLGGGVRIETNAHAFGYVEHGKRIQSSIGIINTSKTATTISIKAVETSGALEISAPKTLQPSQQGTIEFGYYIPNGGDIYGSLQDVLSIEVNGVKTNYQLIINGIAIDNRSQRQDKEPQKVQLSENFIKFGTLKSSLKYAERQIKICNIGMATLNIRKVESQRGVVKVTVDGGSSLDTDGCATLKIGLNPTTLGFGAVTDRVMIVTDDLQYPVKSIKVSAIIEN